MTSLSPVSSRSLLLPTGVALVGLCAIGIGYWYPSGGVVHYVYPAVVLTVACVLYSAHPAQYLGFMWWVWFVTPLFRRLADYQDLTFSTASPIMLAPYLVSGLCLVTVFRYGARLWQPRYAPIGLALLGVGYGYLVGIARAGVAAATFDLLEWATPLLVGFHVIALWREYPAHRRVTRTAFTWGLIVLGAYGVLQFISPAPWDAHWLTASGMTSSIGQPEPYGLRVFSMLNSTGPFAMMMVAGLLLLLNARGPRSVVAAVIGTAAFLLSLVRGAWLVWLIGVGHAALGLRRGSRRRVLMVLALGTLALAPLTFVVPAIDRVSQRVETLSELGGDSSFKARARLYARATGKVLGDPIGKGLGSVGGAAKLNSGSVVSIDSGLLVLPVALGWLGALLYVAGLVGATRQALVARRSGSDSFAVVACAIAVAYLTAMVFANQVTGVKGAVLWTFLALATASAASDAPPSAESSGAPFSQAR